MTTLTEPQQRRQRVAALSKHRPGSPELFDARRDLAAAKIAEYVAKTVAQAPALTPAQVDRITSILRPAPSRRGGDAA